MKKIVLAPDSFKGTMSSSRVCTVMEAAVKKVFPEAVVVSVPIADGGEGCVDAFLYAVGGTKKTLPVKNLFFEDMCGFYGIVGSAGACTEKTAVIETASCTGLPLAAGRLNPFITTTYGVGMLIADALKNGCKTVIAGLGGSATNDGGCGAAAALGVRFFDESDNCFIPTGGTLKKIRRISTADVNPLLKSAKLMVLCDVDNPLYGVNGAAYVFAPQKGANGAAVKELDEGLRFLAEIVKRDTGNDFADYPGAGAAGGMGFGMLGFLGADLKAGTETVLDAVHFDELVKGANYIFTGEGSLDDQSLRGKAVVGIARRAKKHGIPVIAVVGNAENGTDDIYNMGVTAVFSINRRAVPLSEARKTAESDLFFVMNNILRLMRIKELVL